MLDKSEFVLGILVRLRLRKHMQLGKGEAARLLPELDSRLGTWSKKKSWPLGAWLAFAVRR